jgi:NADH-quinone oxidoreductase subunit C
MAFTNQDIQDKLQAAFPDSVSGFSEASDLFSFEVEAKAVPDVLAFLRDDPTLRFNFLTDLCGAHFPDEAANRRFAVIYHMHNWMDNVRIRFKTWLPEDAPEVPTVSSVFASANWQERETYDFYGIQFIGHPDLRRILNMDEMVSFPLRKEFPLEDQGRTDKDDRYFGRIPVNG